MTNFNELYYHMGKLWNKLVGKLKNHSSWFKDYLTEISVVVISIAITFYGDGLIEKYNNKQEDREMMEMVKLELEANLNELTKMVSFYQKDQDMSADLSGYLSGNETAPRDSLEKHFNRHRRYSYWFFKNNAFDIMRVSGTIQRADKDLLMLLFESYEQLEAVKKLDERYMNMKITHILGFTPSLPGGKHGETTPEQWEQIRQHTEFRQFLCNTLPLLTGTAMLASQKALEVITSTLEKIDEKYP